MLKRMGPPSSHWGRALLPELGLNHCEDIFRVFLKHILLCNHSKTNRLPTGFL